MTPEEAAAYAARHYRCPNAEHIECVGPTGTHQLFPCSNCNEQTYANTCWQTVHGGRKRVPSTTPVLCQQCAAQEALW